MILKKLKESTRAQHDAVESSVDVMNRMFTLDDYKELIGRFKKFYTSYEPILPIDELRAAGFDYDERRKLPSLETDAEALNIDGSETYEDLPDLSTLAKVFGSLYVIEGSTLGGQVISRHLKEHLGITPENGGAFFNSYGSQVGPMWKQFGEAITNFAGDGASDGEIVQGAVETFDSISKCVGNKE
ncbi:MAG TPA: biliverdin-producing heme oxygenase [Pyrinomonadaceae bacterium]